MIKYIFLIQDRLYISILIEISESIKLEMTDNISSQKDLVKYKQKIRDYQSLISKEIQHINQEITYLKVELENESEELKILKIDNDTVVKLIAYYESTN